MGFHTGPSKDRVLVLLQSDTRVSRGQNTRFWSSVVNCVSEDRGKKLYLQSRLAKLGIMLLVIDSTMLFIDDYTNLNTNQPVRETWMTEHCK